MFKMQQSRFKPALAAVFGLWFFSGIFLWLFLAWGQAVAQDAADSDPDFALSRAGDAKKGERVFGRCRACHVVTGRQTRAGPSLENIFGRPAGTEPGYSRYSKALRESGIVWNERSLDEWFSSPVDFLPGNKMNLAPIRTARDRMDLIAYLRQATDSP